jgi:hypothetical protein
MRDRQQRRRDRQWSPQHHPAGRPDDAAAAEFPLSAAQPAVARRYDFPSWARLRRYVEVVERYSRFPERMAAVGVAAALVADQATVTGLRAAHPGLADAVRQERPSLIVWAATHGQPGSVELLAGLGFDVNAKGRSDAPAEDPWQTALHFVAMEGHLTLARSLLRLGADPDIRDHRFSSTPLGWARYFGQEQLIDLLEPLTAPDEPGSDAGEPAP